MTKYVVVRRFKDRDNHVYEVNDPYPREGVKAPTKKRITELAEGKNKYNQVYIQEVPEEQKVKE